MLIRFEMHGGTHMHLPIGLQAASALLRLPKLCSQASAGLEGDASRDQDNISQVEVRMGFSLSAKGLGVSLLQLFWCIHGARIGPEL